jgi:hypothetical protein
VPLDVAEAEQDLTVNMQFMLQTHGLEFPAFDLSQLSAVSKFSTQRHNIARDDDDDDDSVAEQKNMKNVTSGAQKDAPRGLDFGVDSATTLVQGSISTVESAASVNTLNKAPSGKKRREVISAVLAGRRMIEIERFNNAASAAGIGEHFE